MKLSYQFIDFMKIMDDFDDDLSLKQKEFEEPLEKATNKDLFAQKDKHFL